MDFNTDVTNRPAYYNSFNSNNKVRPAQTPSGDYGCTPKTCVDTRVPLPDTLKGIFNPPKKRVALRVLSAVIAFMVLLGAVGTGILIEQRRSVTSSGGDSLPEDMEKYQMYDVLPSEVARYVTPASESVQLVVKDIERNGTELTLNEIYEKCSQSVVGITAVSGENGSLGTGIVMDARGYILTNAHVVDDALLLYVTLNNERVYEAMLVGADSDMDVAVLKIDAPDLTAAEFGNSD